MPRLNRLLVAAVAALAVPVALAALVSDTPAAKKSKTDNYLSPDYASYQVQSIALLPVDILVPVNMSQQEEDPVVLVRRYLERGLRPTGYTFVSASGLRAAAKSTGLTESYEALVKDWHTKGELDTTALKALGGARVADAVLAPMITTWNRSTIDPSVAGQSITEIGLLLALYSTRTGALLWRESYLEKGEGPYNNPGTGGGYVTGVQGSTLGNTARTSTALDPPTYGEIVTNVSKKVEKSFPKKPEAAPEKQEEAAPEADDGSGS